MQAIISQCVQGVVVKLNEERFAVFQECLSDGKVFGQPIPDFVHNNHYPLICFVITNDHLCYFTKGKAGQRAGTQLRRVNLSNVYALQPAIPVKRLPQNIPDEKLRKGIENCLKIGGMFSYKGLSYVANRILSLQPDTKEFLHAYMEINDDWLRKAPSTVTFNLAMQKEAVLTSLDLAGEGFDRAIVREWSPHTSASIEDSLSTDTAERKTKKFSGMGGETNALEEQPKTRKIFSFIDGLSRKMTEQETILRDFQRFPGFSALVPAAGAIAQFESEDGEERLTIIYADRQPLEKQTGADLIYYNEVYHSFIFVQYKAMEGWEGGYRPNKQLEKQILSMTNMLEDAGAPQPTKCDEFRLHANPFFLKLCPRVQFVRESTGLSSGMYIPLEYWNFLEATSALIGSQGGHVANIHNVGRYLRNTEFAVLVKDAWVGSSTNQSDKLYDIIKETLDTGNSVTYSVKQSAKRRRAS